MASRKEYEMLFQLNAQMGNSYNSTFSSAQQQIVSLQNEINALSSLQSDISAYEKQQQAVENTKAKLETLEQQYKNIETEIQNTEGFSSSLENQLLSKQQQIDKTSASLEKQTEKLDEMGKALEDAGVDTSNLTGESERLEKEMGDVKEAQEDVAESAKDMGDAGTNAISDIEQILSTAGIAAALKEICDAFMECINVAASFESTMSTVEAISGATSEEMEQLTACAKELGSTTAFTAQQSAEAMTYMAMAGWETEDMLSGMQGVMDLAAASGEDLAQVADIVTDAMTAFGMEASESAHFADVLAATATNSNTSVSQMGETFKNVAPLAGTLGYSIEDVSVLMGLMADNGTKASTAGTALKNTLNGLVSGATLSCDALGDYEISVVNSDGTTKELSDTIDELRWAFDQMTEQEKISNAQTIAGTRSYTGLLAILNSTDEQYEELTESINTCSGAANEMAEIKLDNMTGSLTLMQSAWEGLRITIGEQFTPALSKLYDMLANVMGWIDQFIQNNPIIVKLIAAVVAGVTAFAVALGVYTAATKIAKAATDALTTAMNSNAFIIAATAIVGIVSAVVLFATTARDDGLPALEDLTTAAQNLNDTMDTVSETYNNSVGQAEAAATAAGDYVDRLFELQDAGLDTAESQDEFNAICTTLLEIMPELSDYIVETTDSYGNLRYEIVGTKEDIEDLIETQKEQAIAEAYNQAMADSYSAYAEATVELTKNQQLLEGATRDLEEAETSRTNAINEISDALVESCGYTYDELEGMDMLNAAVSDLGEEYIDMYNSIDDYNDAIYEGRKEVELYQNAVDDCSEALDDAEAVIGTTREAYDAYKDSIDAATAAEEEAAAQQEALNAQVDDFSVYVEDVSGQIDALTEAYQNAYDAAYQSVSGQYDLWDEAAEVTAISADTINKNLQGQIDYWSDYNANLEALGERTDDIEGLGDVIASFADGSEESVNAVAGLAEALAEGNDEALSEMVSKYQELQEQQVTVSDSIAQMVTDYTDQMQQLVDQVAEDIDAMNLSDEAAQACQDTLNAYIDAAGEMEPLVGAAYQAVASSANAALDSLAKNFRVSMSTDASGVTLKTDYYARGTDDAAKGLAVVGEEGPELVYFSGGEQVIPNDETKQLLALAAQNDITAYSEGTEIAAILPQLAAILAEAEGTGTNQPVAENAIVNNNSYETNRSVAVTINISGDASKETVQELQGYGDEFAQRVLAVIEEYDEDVTRGAYA